MGDERLREQERRWRESRSVEDEAAYLVERVRVGAVSRTRLVAAAVAGSAVAARAADTTAGAAPARPGSWLRRHLDRYENFREGWRALSDWASGFDRASAACGVLLRVECARVSLPLFESAVPTDERPRRLLLATSAWCDDPCDEHVRQVAAANGGVDDLMETLGTETRHGSAAQATRWLARAGATGLEPPEFKFLVHCLQGARLDPWDVLHVVQAAMLRWAAPP